MSDDAIKPPRFPYVAALLCAACLGAAAWTWMRYSYAWEVTSRDLGRQATGAKAVWLRDRYVRLRGFALDEYGHSGDRQVRLRVLDVPYSDSHHGYSLTNVVVLKGTSPPMDSPVVFKGRVRCDGPPDKMLGVLLEPSASRFHGASIAGLVVGAMGVFVFTVALRHWLRERRRSRERARA